MYTFLSTIDNFQRPTTQQYSIAGSKNKAANDVSNRHSITGNKSREKYGIYRSKNTITDYFTRSFKK